jgi:hypothetical protein
MRRNLTKGQQAMALAMMYPESENGGRGNSDPAIFAVIHARVGHLDALRVVGSRQDEWKTSWA